MTQLEVDPDPTPTVTPWEEYLAAAQSLDAVRRDAAATAVAITQVVTTARVELSQLHSRLERQRTQLTGEAIRANLAAPHLLPTAAEQATASATVGTDPTAVPAALRQCQRLIETCDAELAASSPAERGWWPPPRSVLIATVAIAIALLLCAGATLWYLIT